MSDVRLNEDGALTRCLCGLAIRFTDGKWRHCAGVMDHVPQPMKWIREDW